MIADTGDKLSPADKAAVESAIEELKKANAGTDVEAVKRATDALMQASHKMAEEAYKAAGSEAGGGAAPGGEQPGGEQPQGGAKKDDVVDAEFEEQK